MKNPIRTRFETVTREVIDVALHTGIPTIKESVAIEGDQPPELDMLLTTARHLGRVASNQVELFQRTHGVGVQVYESPALFIGSMPPIRLGKRKLVSMIGPVATRADKTAA